MQEILTSNTKQEPYQHQERDRVYIRDQDEYGEVKRRLAQPRSYIVTTETGSTIMWDRHCLIDTGERMKNKCHSHLT